MTDPTQPLIDALAEALGRYDFGLGPNAPRAVAAAILPAFLASDGMRERDAALVNEARAALVTVAQWDSWASEWLAKHPIGNTP